MVLRIMPVQWSFNSLWNHSLNFIFKEILIEYVFIYSYFETKHPVIHPRLALFQAMAACLAPVILGPLHPELLTDILLMTCMWCRKDICGNQIFMYCTVYIHIYVCVSLKKSSVFRKSQKTENKLNALLKLLICLFMSQPTKSMKTMLRPC